MAGPLSSSSSKGESIFHPTRWQDRWATPIGPLTWAQVESQRFDTTLHAVSSLPRLSPAGKLKAAPAAMPMAAAQASFAHCTMGA
eukprot:11154658-Lingulodinium_polyedra.AAC.1